MRVLLDTCVLSELYRPDGAASVKEMVTGLADKSLHISAITLGEITKGIDLLPDGRKKKGLSVWLTETQNCYAGRILSIGPEVALVWGEITARCQRQGVRLPAADGLIAATALRHGLHLVTRNVKDFQKTGVIIVNPWECDGNEWKQYRDEGKK